MTDHQPLTIILGPKKALAAARIQRWALLLSAYNYEVKYRSTKEHTNADALSRLPLKHPSLGQDKSAAALNIRQIEMLPVSFKRLQKETRRDPILSRVVEYT